MNSKDNNKDNLIINKIIQINNNALSNDYIRTFIIIISGVFIGYTIQPIPKWLNNIFDTSYIFKFLVLFYTGVIALYPLTQNNIKWITTGTIFCIYLFEMFRKYNK